MGSKIYFTSCAGKNKRRDVVFSKYLVNNVKDNI